MGPTDRKRFMACLLACAELYGKQISDAAASLWWRALESFEIEGVESAFGRHINNADNGQFMPKPADILRMLQGTAEEASLLAWSKVDKAVRTVGPYQSVVFDDPFIHRVLQDMGGWSMLAEKDDEAWPFVCNEFRARYRGYRSRGDIPPYTPRLVGIAEAHNARHGHRAEAPVLIGNPERAQRVLLGGATESAIAITRKVEQTVELLTAPA